MRIYWQGSKQQLFFKDNAATHSYNKALSKLNKSRLIYLLVQRSELFYGGSY
jgi:hypothetical protein